MPPLVAGGWRDQDSGSTLAAGMSWLKHGTALSGLPMLGGGYEGGAGHPQHRPRPSRGPWSCTRTWTVCPRRTRPQRWAPCVHEPGTCAGSRMQHSKETVEVTRVAPAPASGFLIPRGDRSPGDPKIPGTPSPGTRVPCSSEIRDLGMNRPSPSCGGSIRLPDALSWVAPVAGEATLIGSDFPACDSSSCLKVTSADSFLIE